VFDNPVNPFVAGFIGSPPMNQLDGVVESAAARLADGTVVPLPEDIAAKLSDGRKVVVGFRPDAFAPKGHSLHPEDRSVEIEAPVIISEPLGTETIIFTQFGGKEVQAKMLDPRPLEDGETLTFTLDLERLHVFDGESGKSLRA